MSLDITVKLDVKPGENQTQEEAQVEFTKLFRDYLTQHDSQFRIDYGPETWGGYDGPTVTDITVVGPDGSTVNHSLDCENAVSDTK